MNNQYQNHSLIFSLIMLCLVSIVLSSCGDSYFLRNQKKPQTSKNDHNSNRTEENKTEESHDQKSPPDISENDRDVEITNFVWLTPLEVFSEVKAAVYFNDIDLQHYQISAKLWMPSMNHGSYPISIHKVATNQIELREIFFTMPGDWTLTITLQKINTQNDPSSQKSETWEITL